MCHRACTRVRHKINCFTYIYLDVCYACYVEETTHIVQQKYRLFWKSVKLYISKTATVTLRTQQTLLRPHAQHSQPHNIMILQPHGLVALQPYKPKFIQPCDHTTSCDHTSRSSDATITHTNDHLASRPPNLKPT